MHKPHIHRDYTIGWICPLVCDQAAALAMLDDRHDHLSKPSTDINTYTLGSICGHNIVIASLPMGIEGPVSAAAVAVHMISTFPAIKLGLLVGVAGGIPSKVRLGDVVVSTPANQYPGVVQWDHGKHEVGGFQRTGVLNSPATSLLAALAKMESWRSLKGSKIPEILKEAGKKIPKFASNFLRSNLEDVLFQADYGHANKKEKNCAACDKSKVVKREPRAMQIHYGLIASGNSIIKSVAVRDQLCRDLKDVLCVEMEAAGIMNVLPCLVIRGICNYADSHKNNIWQEPAAATAAAFAKEFLGFVPPTATAGAGK